MIRRVPSVTVAAVAAVALLMATPANADEPASDPTPAITTTPPSSGSIDEGGEVTVPNPSAVPARSPRVLVFGDSISATRRYSMTGAKRPKVWWSFLAEHIGIPARQIMVSADGGSGLLARGTGVQRLACSGSTFGERVNQIAATNPDVVIVAAGRNDVNTCRNGYRVRSTAAERRQATRSYFASLASAVDRQGLRRSNVYVATPWGSFQSTSNISVTTLLEREATARGFTWVPTPALVRQETLDGTHPNTRGSQLFAASVVRGSDIIGTIRSRGVQHHTPPVRQRVLCTTVNRCRAQGIHDYRYATSTQRLWGLRARTDGHYVAHRLTRGKARTAPLLTARTARAWRTAATREAAARQMAHAKVGDVAWWGSAPAGSARASQGHVAVVERVAKDNSWVIVSEVTSRGTFRAVRHSGRSLPRAYLRFKRTGGGPRGSVTAVNAKRGVFTVRGVAIDTDRPHRGVRIRLKVTQKGRTWTRTTSQAGPIRFTHDVRVPGLRAGKAAVRITALNTPGSRGKSRTLGVHRVIVR